MARLEFRGQQFRDEQEIRAVLADHGIPYERWGVRGASGKPDEAVLDIYSPEVDKLKRERAYETADLIALRPDTPNLDGILAKFDKEHHHVDDEVRFTVEGEGVFEINAVFSPLTAGGEAPPDRLKFLAEPGDLIVIPENRRHLFYLTDKKTIRCIRLFKTKSGWEAIYEKRC